MQPNIGDDGSGISVGTFGDPLAHGDTRWPAVARMRRFGHLLKPECGKCSLVLDKLDPGLQFEDHPSVLARHGLGGGEHLAGDAPSTRRLCDGNFTDVDAIVPQRHERAAKEFLVFLGDDESLFDRFHLELLNAHLRQGGRRANPGLHVSKRLAEQADKLRPVRECRRRDDDLHANIRH